MEFIIIAAGAIGAMLGISAVIPSDRRDAIRDASAGYMSGQLFPAPAAAYAAASTSTSSALSRALTRISSSSRMATPSRALTSVPLTSTAPVAGTR